MAKKVMTLEEKLEEAIVKDGPYEVPENWVWTKLGVLIKVASGKGLTAKKMNLDGNIPVYGGNGITGYHDESIFEVQQLIIGRVGAQCGNVHVTVAPCWITDNALVVKFDNRILDFKYLYFLLIQLNLGQYNNSSAQPVISGAKIYSTPMVLPPLKEQQRIVDRIEILFEKLDRAKELIEEAREGFENRKAAILEKAFRGELTREWREKNKQNVKEEELFLNIKNNRMSSACSPKEKRDLEILFNEYDLKENRLANGWLKLKASMICEMITCGKTPTGHIVEEGEVPFLKVYNIVDNKINFEYKPQFINLEIHSTKLKSSMLKPNDVIMNIVGPPLKKIAIIPSTYENWNMNQAIVRFRPVEGVNYKFLYYCLIYDETLKDVINETRGVVGQANISVSQSRNLDIIVPCLEEQQEIVRILDKLLEEESKIEELTQLEESIELIKKSILAKAFRGELGTHCDEDESALELLKEVLSKN